MIPLVFDLLTTGLKLWDRHQATKYLDKVLKLKGDYYEEMDKPYDKRDLARLDRLERELFVLGKAFVEYSPITRPDAPT